MNRWRRAKATSIPRRLFHPPPGMARGAYLRLSILAVTGISIAASVAVTVVVQLSTARTDFLEGLLVAVGVPLLVVPPLAYWHHNVLFDLEASKRTIEELSRTDGLTGVMNRSFFFETVPDALRLAERHGYPVALLLMDLDHFKSVNDRFGHQAGDEVLRSTAATVQQTVRGTDILARYGGEEFVVLMPHTGEEEAAGLCGRLRSRLEEAQGNGSR